MLAIIKKLFSSLLALIYPPFCVHCHRLGTILCDNCYEKISFHPGEVLLKLENNELQKVLAVGNYTEVLKSLIRSMKYHSVKAAAELGGELLYYTLSLPRDAVVVPVPLHQWRQDERGFNQAAEIAKSYAKASGREYLPLLKRVKNTKSQAKSASKQERLQQLRNSFAPNVAMLKTLEKIPKTVILVDDVCTTGTTLNECAAVLKKTGVEKIFGAVVAHGA